MSAPYRLLDGRSAAELVAFGPGGERTVGELLSDVVAVSRRLPPATDGSHVAVACRDRYVFCVALLAAWEAGHAVALPSNGRPETVAAVAARAEVLALVHDVDGAAGLDLRPLLAAGLPAGRLAPIAPDRVIATVFSSGSTGDFQPSAKTAGQLIGEADALHATLGVTAGERLLVSVPPNHVYGLLFGVLLPLRSGGAFGRDLPLHAETLAARVSEGATTLISVPAHLRGLEVLSAGRLHGLARVVSSTAPLPAETADMLRTRHGLTVVEALGSTETGGIAWRNRGPDAPWQPLPGVTIAVDPDGHLLVTSPFLDAGVDAPFRTSDRVAMREGGGFDHLGRVDDVVKVGGRRVSLAHLARRLRDIDGVEDAAVISVADDGRNARLLAAVVAPGRAAADLRLALGRWFEPSLVPRRFRFVAALPREATGKLTRASLLALFDSDPAREASPTLTLEVGAHTHSERREGERHHVTHSFELRVPEDLYYFRGHFPEAPILPGIVQLHEAVLPRIVEVRPGLGRLLRVQRLKFRRPIRPGEHLTLALTYAADVPEVDFTLAKGETPCASGRLIFEPQR